MPLSIELRPHEKIFINGAVIANGPERTHIVLLNEAAVLREKDILTEERADTPCKQIYFSVQSIYMDPDNAPRYLQLYEQLSHEVRGAAPSTTPFMEVITEDLSQGRIYPALKAARKLIEYELELMNHGRPPA